MGDRGSAAVLMVAMAGVVAVVGMGSASVGLLLSVREVAATAAEAASLAAAVATYPPASSGAPVVVASEMAEQNGAQLESCRCAMDSSLRVRRVTVVTAAITEVPLFGTVVIKGSATAEFDPAAWAGHPAAS